MSIPLRQLIEDHGGGVRGGWEQSEGHHPGRRVGARSSRANMSRRRVLMDFDSMREVKLGRWAPPAVIGDGRIHRHREARSPASATSSSTRAAASARRAAKAPAGCGACWSGWPWVRPIRRKSTCCWTSPDPGRGAHHLRPGRRGRLAGSGPDPSFPSRDRRADRQLSQPPRELRRPRDRGGVEDASSSRPDRAPVAGRFRCSRRLRCCRGKRLRLKRRRLRPPHGRSR